MRAANGVRHAAQKPQRPDQEVDGMAEESGLIAFDGVPDKLQYPTCDEKCERPAPVEEKKRQRNNNQWDADTVRQSIQGMLVLLFVSFHEWRWHFLFPFAVAPSALR